MNYYEDECSRNEDFNDTLLHPARSADETTPLIRNREERVLSSYAGSQASDMDEDSSKTLSLIYNPHMLMMLISAALMVRTYFFQPSASIQFLRNSCYFYLNTYNLIHSLSVFFVCYIIGGWCSL